MTAPLRVAGWATLDDGAAITWTIAEGRRGRRWREVIAHDAAVVHSLLLETDAERRFSHLELARADGLWTFHPEPDGTLHGNHVDAGDREVHHVAGMRFGPDDLLIVEGSRLAAAATAWRLVSTVPEASVGTYAGVILHAAGSIEAVPDLRVERISATHWRIGDDEPFDVDAAGMPVIGGGADRPLEIG